MSMKDSLGKLMEQAQKMQAKMQEAQAELENITIEGDAGGGLVKVEMTGKHDVKKVSIDDSLYKQEEKTILEDLIAAAIRDAIRKIENETRGKMASLTSGLNLPPGFKPPFEN